jgi:hypothetical protein
MANVHVLTQQGGRIRMVFHVPIPNTNNPRGINYRTALVNAGLAHASVLPSGDGTAGTIAAAEVASLAGGALVEEVRDVKRAPTSNAEIDALFTKVSAEMQSALQAALTDFGFTR